MCSSPWWRSGLRSRSLVAFLAAVCITAIGAAAGPASAGASAPHWVEPGAAVTISDVHCKVGLLLHQGKKVYAAVPASCTALPNDEGTTQWGCVNRPPKHPQAAAMAPIGSPAKIAGAKRPVTLVYDSFAQMQLSGEHHANKCFYNDLALLKLKPVDAMAARGEIPGTQSPSHISQRGPASGSHLSDGQQSATAGSTAHRGWLYQLSSSPTFTASDIGTPFVQGGRLFGMLTQLPQSKDVVLKTDAGISNLHRALRLLRKSPPSRFHHLSFRHVKLLRAGQRA